MNRRHRGGPNGSCYCCNPLALHHLVCRSCLFRRLGDRALVPHTIVGCTNEKQKIPPVAQSAWEMTPYNTRYKPRGSGLILNACTAVSVSGTSGCCRARVLDLAGSLWTREPRTNNIFTNKNETKHTHTHTLIYTLSNRTNHLDHLDPSDDRTACYGKKKKNPPSPYINKRRCHHTSLKLFFKTWSIFFRSKSNDRSRRDISNNTAIGVMSKYRCCRLRYCCDPQ